MQSAGAQPTQGSTSPQTDKSKGSPSSPSASPERIPRPPNSFIIYRKEQAIKYPGLVATVLSAKLGHAWRNEPPEELERYAQLAEIAKENHKLTYPDWKFTPAKRGTGKRARKQAAAAQAAMKAAGILAVQTGSLRQSDSKRSKHTAPKKRTSRSFDISALATPSPSPSASSSPSPPPEERITPANRPRRNIQHPERFSPCGYRERSSRAWTESSSSPDLKSSVSKGTSLFFSTHSGRSSRPTKTLKSSASTRSMTSTSSSESHEGSSDTYVDVYDFDGFDFSDDSLSPGEDEDEEEEEYDEDYDLVDSDYDDNRTTLCSTDVDQESFSQSDCVKSPSRPRSRSPSFQSDEPLLYDTTFPFPHTMENFEPECLPRSDQQWPITALVGSFGVVPIEPHIQPNPMLFSEYIHLTPGLEEPIIDFAAYANFDDQDNIEVKAESKDSDKTVVCDSGSEAGTRALNLAVDIIAASVAVTSCSPFPMDSMIPLKLLSPTTTTARAMESMSLSAVASSDNDGKHHKGTECR